MMKEQKVIITDYPNDINVYLDKGWIVVNISPNHAGTYAKWCFVIENQKLKQ